MKDRMKRRNPNKISLFLLAACATVFAAGFAFTREGSKEYVVIIPRAFDAIVCEKKNTISTTDDAMRVLLCDSDVKKTLSSFQNEARYESWRITIEKTNRENEQLVYVHSLDLIPSTACSYKINALGQLSILSNCQYNK